MKPNFYPTSYANEIWPSLEILDSGELELTPKRNTILHLLAKVGDVKSLKTTLENHSSLIYRRNHEGESPIYVAAREGHIDILDVLINYVKEEEIVKLATRSLDKQTALHIAIENHHPGVVFWLVNKVPQLANQINDFNESPLYLAAERSYFHIFNLLLDGCKQIAFDGPKGKTALHALASIRAEDKLQLPDPEYIRHILQGNIKLLYIYDKHGWTPLHYAVHYNQLDTTKELLKADPFIGYQMTKGDNISTSAIHIAASQGHFNMMETIMSICHGCSEIVDSKGMNMLHVAVENKQLDVIKRLLRNESLATLINQRDSNGNTPMHLFMASDLEIEEMIIVHRVNMYVRNNENLTPLDVAFSEEKRQRLIKTMAMGAWKLEKTSRPAPPPDESEIQMLIRLGDSVVLVVTLIVTATFAAAFTVPGGFDGNEGSEQGMPILLGKAAYITFVASNALAFSCSCCVLFTYIRLQFHALYLDQDSDKEVTERYSNIVALQYLLTGIAMIAMAVAFISGSYVILTQSLPFAILLCATCVCIIVPLSIFPGRHLGFASAIVSKLV